MNCQMKIFIFTPLSKALHAPLVNKIKTFREASYLHLPLSVETGGRMFLRGLFIWLMEYLSSRYSNKVYLPLQLIRDAVDNNYLDSLCYYLWIKKLHHKPVIYAYSLRKIAGLIKCSPTTVKHHLDVLKAHSLVNIAGGNLILKSTNEFYRERQLMVPVQISNKKQEQRNFLRFTLIKRNLHTQVTQFNVKSNALNFHKGIIKTYNEIRSGLRLVKLFPDAIALENSMQDELTLSNKKFGSLCNRSQSTGIKIQKALNSLQVLISRSRTKLIDPKKHNRREFFRLELPSSTFLSKQGQVYKRLTNGIRLVGMKSSIALSEQ